MALNLSGMVAYQYFLRLSSRLDMSTPIDKFVRKTQYDFQNGAAANQANRLFHDTRVLSASNVFDDLNLTTLSDAFGLPVSLANVKSIMFKALLTNTNDMLIHSSVGNAFIGPMHSGAAHRLQPGAAVSWTTPTASGWIVTGSANILRVANVGNINGSSNIMFDVAILGVSSASA